MTSHRISADQGILNPFNFSSNILLSPKNTEWQRTPKKDTDLTSIHLLTLDWDENGVPLRDSLVTERAFGLGAGTLFAHDTVRAGVGDHTSWCLLAYSAFHRFLFVDGLYLLENNVETINQSINQSIKQLSKLVYL